MVEAPGPETRRAGWIVTLKDLRSRNKTMAVTALLGAALLLLAGCTPKRVLHHEIPTGETTRPVKAMKSTPEKNLDVLPKQPLPQETPREDFASRAVRLARQQLGKMYQWGAQGPDRFDCSGLVYFVYGQLGVSMPRVSSRQAGFGQEISRDSIRPGDLLYFNTSGRGINHVGIYVGNAKFIHAPRKGMPVRTDSLHNGWWKQKYRGARRIKS
jgi:cell wall-associated NlpC family hydrolase